MKQRLVIRPCYCDRITKAIDAYIRKADNDLSKQLGKEGYTAHLTMISAITPTTTPFLSRWTI